MSSILSAEQRYDARIGLEVVRCRDGKTLYRHRGEQPMTPASLVKIISTGAALKVKGPGYRFSTSVYTQGQRAGSALQGNLVVQGGADPSLGSRLIPQDADRFAQELIGRLKQRGIARIEGDIIVRAHHREMGVHPTWLAEDIGEYYGAGLYGINYADNTLNLWVGAKPRGRKAYSATLEGDAGCDISWVNQLSVGRGASTSIALTPLSPVVYVKGSISPRTKGANLRPANPIPANYFANRLHKALSDAGIAIGGRPQPLYTPEVRQAADDWLYTYYSKTLDTLSVITNHRSQNLYAEAIASLLSSERVDRGSALTSFWQQRLRLPKGSISIVDGSGLSRMNRIAPSSLSLILRDLFGGYKPYDGALVATLPQVGVDGTVRSLIPAEHITAYLKSGSMRGVQGYAGYVEHQGEWYILVYMTEGFPSNSIAKGVLRQFLAEVFP